MKKRFKFIAPLFALVFGLILPNTAFGAGVNCDNFSTWRQAQDWFESHGGDKNHNVEGLDRDHDGIACETSLPGYNGETWESLHPAGAVTPTPTPTPTPAPMPSTATNNLQTLIIGIAGIIGYFFLRRTLNKSGS